MLLNLDSNLNSAAWPKTLKAVPEGNPRFRGQNLWPSSWVWFPALLGLVWGASTNTGCYRVCGSGCWPLFEEFWAICLCKQSSPRLLMIVNNHLLSYWFCSILQSFIGFWVKIWHRNKQQVQILCKAADLTWLPVLGKGVCSDSNWTAQWLQMAASKKLEKKVNYDSESIATKVCSQIGSKWNATCPRKGYLLRFESNSTATSDGGAQKLGNNVWQRLTWFWIDCNQSLQPNL